MFEGDHKLNLTKESVSSFLPKDHDVQAELDEAVESVHSYDWRAVTEEEVQSAVTKGIIFLLPFFYLYTWVAARSLYFQLSENEVQPLRLRPGPRRSPNRLAIRVGAPVGAPHTGAWTTEPAHRSSPTEQHQPAPWYVDGLRHELEQARARDQLVQHMQAYQRQHGGLVVPHAWYQEPHPG